MKKVVFKYIFLIFTFICYNILIIQGEVIIQRLNWQKVCTFPSPGENIKIRALSWQPNEAVIAVGKIYMFLYN